MAFMKDCGTIILDAVLTQTGRRKMANGNFKISKFALGDDEINYAFYLPGETDHTNQTNIIATPILEACGNENANILYGLLNFPRNDVSYVPQLISNDKTATATLKYATTPAAYNRYFLCANEESVEKLKIAITNSGYSAPDRRYLLNNSGISNMLIVESGIPSSDEVTLEGNSYTRERYITNLGLMDKYVFVHCDSRFVDNILVNPPDAHFKNDGGGNMYMNFSPLIPASKTSLPSVADKYEVYRATTVNNGIYDLIDGSEQYQTSIDGPRGFAFGLNLNINGRLTGDSTSSPDDRYTRFGITNVEILGAGAGKWDWIQTNVLIEGCSTGRRLNLPITIIRYAGA